MTENTGNPPAAGRLQHTVSLAGLGLGPVVAILVGLLLPDTLPGAEAAIELTRPARITAAVAALMAIWWLTEAIPLSATALLPLALLPLLRAMGMADAAAPYANPVIFLFLGGFMLGLAMERWGLHKRIALLVIMAVGSGPRSIIAGFMIATAMLSAFVSNTATVIMLIPIATSVLATVHDNPDAPPGARQRFATCLVLAIAYSASIGGAATLIGTPPNAVLAGFVADQGERTLSFGRWLLHALPLVVVLLPICFVLLTGPMFRVRGSVGGSRSAVRTQFHELGRMKPGEWVVLVIFSITALLWIFRKVINSQDFMTQAGLRLSDAQIAMFAAIALFVVPVDKKCRTFAMDWDTASRAPFGILLLFGGGLSLAAAVSATGLDVAIGQQFALLQGMPLWVIVLGLCLLVTFLTELTSNTAVTTALLPVLAAAAPVMGVDAAYLLLPAAVSASCAFMLPVATPPNAVAFASGRVTIGQMARTGVVLNVLFACIITLWVMLVAPSVFG
ncbi:MAG: DASS family sodium-coupled anion symporter [Phycisphaera sp.]|nr:MAG: DASS family sodium-coupled anion symporter [Phycisphaera sp.]